MPLDPTTCYRALTARDARFDGIFFVGVTTTGVYCRPVCPARTPRRERCRFFARTAEAERAGFRACFRCRPEVAPGGAPVDAVPRLVRNAAARIEEGFLNEHSVDELAETLGVTSRHLRRSMEAEIGVTPVELAQTRRLALAKQLLQDSDLPLAQIAFAAGFSSIRRFNALFHARFGRAPRAVRETRSRANATIALRLDYRAPFEREEILEYLAARATPGVEEVVDGTWRKVAVLGKHVGWIEARFDAERAALRARISASLAPRLTEIAARLRALFDLDARPDVLRAHFAGDRVLAPLVRARPGLRVPGAFDGYETAVRAILGQQITVRGATTLAGRLAERFGPEVSDAPGSLSRALPPAATLSRSRPADVAAIGLPLPRAAALVAMARAVDSGAIVLARGADPEATMAALLALPGVGPWTAQYIAMRALGWPDAFPAGDIGIRRALRAKSTGAAEARADAWRPWRAYAAEHLWHSSAIGG